jgi:hypothetical protein
MSTPDRVIKLRERETVRFVELYADEPVLYDASMENYRDRDVRMAAAKRISNALAIPAFGPKEVMAKFKDLRSSYCQELKKIADSERSGSGTDDIYVPKVFWFHQMNSFIRPFVQQRATQSNLVSVIKGNYYFFKLRTSYIFEQLLLHLGSQNGTYYKKSY